MARRGGDGGGRRRAVLASVLRIARPEDSAAPAAEETLRLPARRPRPRRRQRLAYPAPSRPGRRRAGQGVADRAEDRARSEGSISPRCPARDRVGGSSRRTSRRPPASGAGRRAGRAPAAAAAAPRERPETAKGAVEVVEPTKLQQTVARRMAESKATAPHFYLQARGRHDPRVRGAGAAQGRRRRGRRGPVVQRHGRQGVRDRAARVPARQRRLPRRDASSSTRGSTSGSRSPPRTRSSCRRSSTPTARACARSRPRPGRWPARCATARSPRPSSRAAPSPSPISACTGSPTSAR